MKHRIRLVRNAAADLSALDRRWALVGGMAVGARTEPRFTRDIDVALAADDDTDAESMIFRLQQRGYEVATVLEQLGTERLATVRLRLPGADRAILLDVLFASSGIEPEVAAAATPLRIAPKTSVPVAAVGHLIAMKILARNDEDRPQDRIDLRALLGAADDTELDRARTAVTLIEARGFHRGRPLATELERTIQELRPKR